MNAEQLIRTVNITGRALDLPPDEAGLDALAEWLLSDDLPETTMTLEEFDGFCCALAVGPRAYPPSAWLPVVFGDDEMPALAPGDARRFVGLLLRHQRAVAAAFAAGPDAKAETPAYLPWVLDVEPEAGGDDDDDWPGRWWAAGFNAAIAEWERDWAPLCEDEQAGELIDPFATLEQGFADGDDVPFVPDALLEQCLLAAFEMRRWWNAQTTLSSR